MGLLDGDGIFGTSGPDTPGDGSDEYVDLDSNDLEEEPQHGDMVVYHAEVKTRNDIETVKDEIYAGNIIFVDVGFLDSSKSLDVQTVESELAKAAQEVEGDVAKQPNGSYIFVPNGPTLSRESLC